MDYTQYYDVNIVLPRASFIAYIFYVSADKELNIVLKKGQHYRFTITDQVMNEIIDENNRGNYIARKIIHNKTYRPEHVQTVSRETIQFVIGY